MGPVGATLITAAVVVVVALLVAPPIRRRLGAPRLRDLPPATRRRIWITLAGSTVVYAVVAWLFAAGHPLIGVGVLAAVFIGSELVLLPLRIRRARRDAAHARARRARD